ncbi:MAG: nucleotide sugar dehydrogenase [Nitrospinota bacterium]|nr:nucleotide sugar dehydrogenase [Nitrospinota bacterium]
MGLGYVGLPLLLEFGKAGFPVTGLDVDQSKLDKLACGESYIRHISHEAVKLLTRGGTLKLSAEFSAVTDLDCILICVPTPLNRNRSPNMTYIVSTAEQISPYLCKGQLVVLESTTYPGTTREVLAPGLEAESGRKAGQDFFLAYSPEREDPNNKQYTTGTIPKVVGADSPQELAAVDALYQSVVEKTVPVSDTRTAEATKLMENIFRSVNIALVNEMNTTLDKMGIDIWEVIEAASTKPFGYMPFYPGPGLGGHCIPIDPFYLAWKAREYEAPTRFIELAGDINVAMPEYVFQKIANGLNSAGKSLKESRIVVLGVAYKKNVDDDRESVSFKIMDMLTRTGATVEYNDPYIPVIGSKRDYPQFVGKKQVALDQLPGFDMTVILTDHSEYDYKKIVADSQLVVDTRNACRNIDSDKIIKA